MSIKKLRKNINQEFKINKYDLFVTTMNEIGDFSSIFIEIYFDNMGYDSDEYIGFKINSGWSDDDETETYISQFCWGIESEDKEIRVYYTYEEFLHYFLTYYLENIHCYANMIMTIEQEFINYTKHRDYAKKYGIKLNTKKIFKRDKLRNFLLDYNNEENKYLYGFINYHNEYINYWDIDILKKFMSYLMGKDVLRKFLEGKREFQIETTYYFGYRGYDKGFNIELDGNSVLIDYYTQYNRLGNYYNVIDKTGIAYKENTRTNKYLENFVTKDETDKFLKERFKGTRDKMNVEVVSKQDFVKELEIIVNAYEEIYNDDEIRSVFEKFKEELGE